MTHPAAQAHGFGEFGNGKTAKVEFANDRQKVKKDSEVLPNGDILTRFIFRNGEMREHMTSKDSPVFARAAMHGLDQKFGDGFAGENDVEDCILSFEKQSKQLAGGEWRIQKEEGVSGTSLLLRALMEHTGKPKDWLRDQLAAKTPAQKKALRAQKDIAKIIARLQAEKATKTPVDPHAADKELASMFA